MILRALKSRWFLGLLIIQVIFLFVPDTMGDLYTYEVWMRNIYKLGLSEAYWGDVTGPIDYPPIIPYLLYGIAFISDAILGWDLNQGYKPMLLVKLCFIAANSLLLLHIWKAQNLSDDNNKSWLLFIIGLPLCINTAYWGQSDSLIALLVIISLQMTMKKRSIIALIILAIACFTKHTAWPFAPFIIALIIKKEGILFWKASLGAALISLLILLPFIIQNNLIKILESMFLQIDAMPYMSINAHNFWWLSLDAIPWTRVDETFLNIPFSTIANTLVLSVAALAIYKIVKEKDGSEMKWLFVTALGLFLFSARMHENHLFYALVFGSILVIEQRKNYLLVSALAVTYLLNILLHDPWLMNNSFRLMDPIIEAGYHTGGNLNVIQLILTKLNALNLLLITLLVLSSLHIIKAIPRSILLSAYAVFALALIWTSFQKDSRFHSFTDRYDEVYVSEMVDNGFAFYHYNGNLVEDPDGGHVIFAHAPANFSYSVQLEGEAIKGAIGIGKSGIQITDGVAFEIKVNHREFNEVVFLDTIFGSANKQDAAWHNFEVPISHLPQLKDDKVQIEFRTYPLGNNEGDLSAWKDVRITYK